MKALTKYILSEHGGKVVIRDEIEEACKRFDANPRNTINFMIHYGYLIRILRGLYYVKTVEEFKLKKSIDIYKTLSLGMEKLGINWYFGLYTSLKLNGVSHEFFNTLFILSDKIFRQKEIKVIGEEVKFIKLKSGLFGFGIVGKLIKFSDLEKTLLDFIYISRYRSVPVEKTISMIKEYENIDKRKTGYYLHFYPKTVRKVVEDAGFI